MKKLLIILLLLIGTIAYSKVYIIKTIKVGNNIIYIMCIDGYKYMLARDRMGHPYSSPSILQMQKNYISSSNTIFDTCEDK